MCVVVVLAVLLLPVLGGVIGLGVAGASGAWIGALIGLVIGVGLVGLPIGLFLAFEKRKYDREEREDPYAGSSGS